MSKAYYRLMWMCSSEDTLSDKSTQGQEVHASLPKSHPLSGIVGNPVFVTRSSSLGVRPMIHVTMKILHGLEDHKIHDSTVSRRRPSQIFSY